MEGGSWQGDVSRCTGSGFGMLACVGRTQGHKGRRKYSASVGWPGSGLCLFCGDQVILWSRATS